MQTLSVSKFEAIGEETATMGSEKALLLFFRWLEKVHSFFLYAVWSLWQGLGSRGESR